LSARTTMHLQHSPTFSFLSKALYCLNLTQEMLNLGLETFSHLVPGLHMFLPNKKKKLIWVFAMAHCRCWLTRSIFECSPKFGPFQLNTISLPVMTSFLSIWHTVFTVNVFSLFLETSKLLIGMAHPLYSKFKQVATKVKNKKRFREVPPKNNSTSHNSHNI
jgi:hypothetical protein